LVGIRDNRPNLIKAREAEALQASRAISKELAYVTSRRTVENSPILQYRFELAFTQPKKKKCQKKKKEKGPAQLYTESKSKASKVAGVTGRTGHHDTTQHTEQQEHQTGMQSEVQNNNQQQTQTVRDRV
jgi:hypothetical protein